MSFIRKEIIACCFIMLIVLLHFKSCNSHFDDAIRDEKKKKKKLERLSRDGHGFGFVFGPSLAPSESKGVVVYGDELRIVYTGPNPLHNRKLL